MNRPFIFVGLLSLSMSAFADDSRVKELEEQIRQIKQQTDTQIKLLQQQIEELKKSQQQQTVTREETEAIKEEIRQLKLESVTGELEVKSYYGFGPSASKALFNKKGVSIGGYGEVHFNYNPDVKPQTVFDMKRLILYFGYAFNEKLKLNTEIEWEHAFVEGKEESGETTVEFAFLDYNYNQNFGVRGGLLLIPVGIINEYHEPPTFYTVDRPFVERNIIPTTWREVGFGVYGKLGNVEYKGYITNGLKAGEETGEKVEDGQVLQGFKQKGFKAVGNQLAFTGRLDYLFATNLKAGVSTFIGGIQNSTGDKLGNINILSGHLWWQADAWDIRAVGVYSAVSDSEKISRAISTNPACLYLDDITQCTAFPKSLYGFYTQVAYDIFKPLKISDSQQFFLVGTYEQYDTHKDVSGEIVKPEGHKVSVYNFGFSYKPHPLIALKGDYVRFSPSGADKQNIYRFTLGWMF